jgi:hypothetical protein
MKNKEDENSKEVIDPNSQDGQGSVEPQKPVNNGRTRRKKKITPAVRRANRRNSRKVGLFAEELAFTEEDKPEVDKLARGIRAQLQPITALQEIAVGNIIACCWRCKLAIRREMQKLRELFEFANNQEVESEGAVDPSGPSQWYAAGRQDLKSAARWLDTVINNFDQDGTVREEWKKPMDAFFGADFYESLSKWTPMNSETVLMAKTLEMHATTYNLPIPAELRQSSPDRVTIDPNQGREMVTKLMKQELRHLTDLSRSWDLRESSASQARNATSADFGRYYTAAVRDLQRAIESYVSLTKMNL